jgi:hypothetical protein
MPSVKLLMVLLSKISKADSELVETRTTVMQLSCALLHANLCSEDDADTMQVSS